MLDIQVDIFAQELMRILGTTAIMGEFVPLLSQEQSADLVRLIERIALAAK